MAEHDTLRLAAASDLHYSRFAQGKCRYLFTHASRFADVLLLCGDLTNRGGVLEAVTLARDLDAFCQIPVIAVLGNHDFDAGQEDDIRAVLTNAGVILLEGTSVEIGGVGFAGVCGGGGGFGRGAKAPENTVEAAESLESALGQLETPQRVALLHYAPIRQTLRGEMPAIHETLGSSRLEAALRQGGATVAFHGHAHHGSLAGRTSAGLEVFNVALPVLHREAPDRPPCQLYQVNRAAELAAA